MLKNLHVETESQSLYELLGLSFLATSEEIRTSYKRLALRWHPDRNPAHDRKFVLARFQAINQAHAVLNCPERRRSYDLQRLEFWDMKVYLTNFRELALTASGLGLQPYSFERMLHGIKHPVPLLLAA